MKKILVLEDEASIRSFIVINLRRAGYDVIEAETGEEALERLRANPDTKVALLDIMLPGIDGFEVCRRIRATNTKIGIIMLNARPPIFLKKAASGVPLPNLAVPANSISNRKASAIRIPPPITNGSICETPFIRCL